MKTKLTLLVVTAMGALTIYSGLPAAAQSEQRAELVAGQAAPFAGVLLSAEALGDIREEVESLRAETVSLRAALAAQRLATEAADARAEMWKAECGPATGLRGVGETISRYGFVACGGIALGAWAVGRDGGQ
jgi:hypothetical protein